MKKIMIVDDEENIRRLLIRYIKVFFKSLAIPNKVMPEFIEAKDALQAWDILTKDKIIPDLLVVDFQMPMMNGNKLIAQIKKELKIDSEIVMHSGNYLAEEEAERLGCRFVSKAGGEKEIFNLAVDLELFTP